MSIFKELVIRFQTSANVPPPYCYEYIMTLRPTFQFLEADFQMIYTNREELDIEDIETEGFTENDNYTWKGNLEKAWREIVEDFLEKIKLNEKEPSPSSDWLQIEWTNADGQTATGFPKAANDWHFLAQELVQAIYETSEKERPFEFIVLRNNDSSVEEVSLKASFKYRDIQLRRNEDGKPKFILMPWGALADTMEALFAPEYLADQASSKKPHQKGTFVNVGDELWYEVGKQVIEPYRTSNTLTPFRKLLDKLLRY